MVNRPRRPLDPFQGAVHNANIDSAGTRLPGETAPECPVLRGADCLNGRRSRSFSSGHQSAIMKLATHLLALLAGAALPAVAADASPESSEASTGGGGFSPVCSSPYVRKEWYIVVQ